MINANFSLDTATFVCLNDFYRYALTQAAKYPLFFGHGTDNPHDEFRWLLTASLGLPFDAEDRLWQARLTDSEKALLTERLQRRIQESVPVPYLINEAYFCNLKFYVDERVLIPRSPVAELIEGHFSPWLQEESVHQILDLCTGGGCIALALACYFPEAKVDAVDISKDALAVAEINRQNLGLKEQVTLIQSDCWENVPHKRYDLIVSNPPYVGDVEMEELPAEYRHEPDMALRAENNGLALVDKILKEAHAYLSDKGILVVEVGNSAEALQAAYPEVPFLWLDFAHGGQGVFLLTAADIQTYFGMKKA